MLLDEPTRGLDVLGSQVVVDYVRRLRDEGKAVIVSTHRLDEAERLVRSVRSAAPGPAAAGRHAGGAARGDGLPDAGGHVSQLLSAGQGWRERALISNGSDAPPPSCADVQVGRLRRLVLKELREILRDRRTIITLVVMPLLIYPLLAVVFQRFLVTSMSVSQDVQYVIGVDSPIGRQMLVEQLQVGDAALAERGATATSEQTKAADAEECASRMRDA